jgi:hypothetical protein
MSAFNSDVKGKLQAVDKKARPSTSTLGRGTGYNFNRNNFTAESLKESLIIAMIAPYNS